MTETGAGRFRLLLETLGVHNGQGVLPGRVDSLTIGAGAAIADIRVTRQRSYEVRIGIPAFGKETWTVITQAVAENESAAATLLDGRIPDDIEALFAVVLFPAVLFPEVAGELSLDCSCPGVRVPCDHLVAGLTALIERIDTDPFTIFALRGRDRAALLEEVGRHTGSRVVAVEAPAEPDLADFFGWGPAGDVAKVGARRPEATRPHGLLDEVPPLSATVRGTSVSELLRPFYRAFMGDPAD